MFTRRQTQIILSSQAAGSAPKKTTRKVKKLQRGSACRVTTACFAHITCLIEAAQHNADTWDTCPTCLQDFIGEVRLALAQARYNLALHEGKLEAAQCGRSSRISIAGVLRRLFRYIATARGSVGGEPHCQQRRRRQHINFHEKPGLSVNGQVSPCPASNDVKAAIKTLLEEEKVANA